MYIYILKYYYLFSLGSWTIILIIRWFFMHLKRFCFFYDRDAQFGPWQLNPTTAQHPSHLFFKNFIIILMKLTPRALDSFFEFLEREDLSIRKNSIIIERTGREKIKR